MRLHDGGGPKHGKRGDEAGRPNKVPEADYLCASTTAAAKSGSAAD